MSLLRSIESRIERLVEGTFRKAFRVGVQPVELARKLVKEMDDHQRRTMRSVFVPNAYDVYLSGEDHAAFADTAAALEGELAAYLDEHARREGYAMHSRPRVRLHRDDDLERGSFGIAVRIEQPGGAAAESGDGAAVTQPPVAPAETMVQPIATAAGATFRLVGPDGPLLLAGERVSIGRGRTNDLVVHDSSVSREHCEVTPGSAGGYVIRDLESTNGVLVNGSRVVEQQLAAGDRIVLGSAELRFERVEDEVAGP